MTGVSERWITLISGFEYERRARNVYFHISRPLSIPLNFNPRFPGQPPGNFPMMQPGQQFVPGTMPGYPMMQPGMMMQQSPMMQQQQMYQMQMMGMRPGMPPPSYNQAMVDSSRTRAPNAPRPQQQLSPASRRKLEQQQRLKHFSKGQPVNADKFIESMFGKTEKPKPKTTPSQSEVPVNEVLGKTEEDDGFGDFLGGPASAPIMSNGGKDTSLQTPSDIPNTESNSIQAVETSTVTQREEKKDLMTMMLECSDLNAPVKAKTFHKPALKDLHPTNTTHNTHTFQESKQAHHWTQRDEELRDVFTVSEPVQPVPQQPPPGSSPQPPPGNASQTPPKFELPVWCKDDSKVPMVYTQVYEASLVNGEILTERLYPILLMSGLPKESLGQIWSLSNQTKPGQLTKPELYLALALIAFAQNNYTSLSMDVLHKCPQPPVPFLGQQNQLIPPPSTSPPTQPQNNIPANTLQAGQVSESTGPEWMSSGPQSGVNSAENSLSTNAPNVQHSTLMTNIPPQPMMSNFKVAPSGNKATDDDFEDFQEAPSSNIDGKTGAVFQQHKVKAEEPEYLYSVPKPSDLQLSQEQKHSNVRNFFGSDDSSDASTANSIDGDFDDFKSADSKPSDSSQFTSSEQSENEDFKVFESYLDDFNKKKSELESKQESPLHRPIPKFSGSMSSQLPSSAKMAAIPAIKSLFPKDKTGEVSKIEKVPEKGLIPKLGISPPQSSDSDFADFQQAPTAPVDSSATQGQGQTIKPSGSDACLIGEEDKYAALRAFDNVPVSSVFDTGLSSKEGDTAGPSGAIETDEDSWADFQAISTETNEHVQNEEKDKKTAILSLFSNSNNPNTALSSEPVSEANVDADWSGFAGSEKDTSSEWSSFSATNTNVGSSNKTDENFGWSAFSTENSSVATVDQTETSEDWADFQGGSSSATEAMEIKNSEAQGNLVQIKKKNLNTNEILGLFKVREELPSDLKLEDNKLKQKIEQQSTSETEFAKPETPYATASSTKFKPKYSPGLDDDDDPFRIPPPMDDDQEEHDDEYGEFSRGYDLDDVMKVPTQSESRKKNLYNYYGMDIPDDKANQKSTKADDQKLNSQETEMKKSDSINDFCDTDSVSSKDTDGVNWPGGGLSALKGEDSQSVSSLDLPFSKTRVQNVKDADSQSISSNEFGTFEHHLKPPNNPDAKSVDSLDLKRVDSGVIEQTESGSDNDHVVDSSKESTPESNTSDTGSSSTAAQVSTIPVLGDRYSEIMEDIPGSDKHAYEWQRCLESCSEMIKNANNVFNSISSSAVCNEVIKSEQGSEYVEGIVEIYRVVCRVSTSMKSTALSTDKLNQVLKEIDLAWNNLTAFLVGGNMMPDDNATNFRSCLLKSDDTASQYRACGVCLLDVDAPCRSFNREEECGKLTYGGRQYHCTCANFWVNSVDSMLPALKLPELL